MTARRRHQPQRRCIGCDEVKDKRDLIRIVRTPDGEVLWDPSGKRSGRGAYVCKNPDCARKLLQGERLDKALRNPIERRVKEDLVSSIGEVIGDDACRGGGEGVD